MISVLILTRNEEQDICGCLESVAWSDDVHVFDSYSADRTAELASALGATVTHRHFDGYASQRNAALEELPWKHNWVLILDADERILPAGRDEMLRAAAEAPEHVAAFKLRRNDFFLGQWLQHAQIMPWYTRLVRVGHARYTREVNEMLEVDGAIGQLEQPFHHFPFSKGLDHWYSKHNQYSTMEARVARDRCHVEHASWRTALLESDFHKRRRAQKALFYCMPLRPLLRWVYLMFIRGGVLDGYAGWTYSLLQAFYEYMIVLKTREMEVEGRARTSRGQVREAELAPARP
jgi:glycosyltransferase involved in cell wall biosynthesis